jgi:LCP family protein required for cell wall assembly
VAVCLLAAAAGYGYFRWQFGKIPKFSFAAGILRPEGGGAGETMNVLLVGSDSRENIAPGEVEAFGSATEVGGQRSDTIIVLRVDAKAKKAAMLSIPRDLHLEIAGTGRRQRINTAFDGGPERLIATISQSLGVPIDHYVQVDFNGFRGIVEAVGGVPIYVASQARDKVTGLDIRTPGCVTLDGNGALAFVRSRNYEFYESGRWRRDHTGDLGRIQRQQDFIRRALKKAIQKGARNPNTLRQLIDTGVENVKIDDTFEPREIIKVANRFRSLEPDAVEMLTVPTVGARVGGEAVLRLKQPEAQQLIDRFNGKMQEPAGRGEPGRPDRPPVLPSSVRVRVLNGSGVGGQASEASGALQEAGYNIAGTGDADSYGYDRTLIRYGTGQRDKALLLQSQLRRGAQVTEERALRGVDLVLVTGADFGGLAASPPAGAAPAPAPPVAPEGGRPEPRGAPPQQQC